MPRRWCDNVGMLFSAKPQMPTEQDALPGRQFPIPTADEHAILGTPIKGPFPDGTAQAVFGLGCFWGAEKAFWGLDGVYTTAVGYAGGYTPNATYEEVCTGRTGHNEVVLVAYDPKKISYDELLKTFWEGHNPTQGMQQGNDVGTQYRSGIYTNTEAQREAALASREMYQAELTKAGHGEVTAEVEPLSLPDDFYYAEEYHQQYLHKVPNGYCGLGGVGVSCPIGLKT
jgi:peptide-methionine (S)-S-oxide reductase